MKTKLFKLFILAPAFILLCSANLSAQININVHFKTDKVEAVEVWVYDNFIVGTKHLALTAARSEGAIYKGQIMTSHAGKMVVKTGSMEEEYYIQPQYSYDIFISNKGIVLQSDDKTNTLIRNAEILYDEYRKKYIKWPSGNRKEEYPAKMNELVARLDTLQNDNKYFNDLLKYMIATIKFDIIKKKRDNIELVDELEKTYLTDEAIQYHNPMYFEFINQFYFMKYNYLLFMHVPVNTNRPYKTFFSELGLVKNDTLKQVAALYFIEGASHNYWGGDKIITNHLLDSLKSNAVNNTLNESIDYTYKQLNSLDIGEEVKDFNYLDLNNQAVSLSDFKGKWVLLDFWFVGCSPCHESLPDLQQLQSKFESCLEIVGVNPIDAAARILKYKEKYNIDWPLYSSKNDSNIKRYFNIESYPTYFLIDPNGKFRLIPKEVKLGKLKNKLESIIQAECR